jgi:hypothetical protein
MANVKLNRKALLDKFQAEILIDRGEKITQQELLDKCIEFCHEHFDNFVSTKINQPRLTKETVKRILENSVDCELHALEKTDDELIYGL